MTLYRQGLPQLGGDLYLCDAGLETDLIFNHGIEIPQFAAHTLLATTEGRASLAHYFRGFLDLARDLNTGFILDSQTWKAHSHWAAELNSTEQELQKVNCDAIDFIAELRNEYSANTQPIVLNGLIGPCGDAYRPDVIISAKKAYDYHTQQIKWLAQTEVDMISALTFNQSSEAIGVVHAAKQFNLPVVVSFTVETDGKLPTGQSLSDAIEEVDAETDSAAEYFMINCAHPEHFIDVLRQKSLNRIRGLRCNASRCSHEELDESETLDSGNPVELSMQYKAIVEQMPWLNIHGGCCGSDLRHVRRIADALTID